MQDSRDVRGNSKCASKLVTVVIFPYILVAFCVNQFEIVSVGSTIDATVQLFV